MMIYFLFLSKFDETALLFFREQTKERLSLSDDISWVHTRVEIA